MIRLREVLPSVRVSEVEVDEEGREDDPDHAERDHGEVEPDVQLHQLVLDDRPILRDLRADPNHLQTISTTNCKVCLQKARPLYK